MMSRRLLVLLASGVGLSLIGCASTGDDATAAPTTEQTRWKLAQHESLGDESNPFKFCRGSDCPGVSRKTVNAGTPVAKARVTPTPAVPAAPAKPAAAPGPADRVVIPFAYNSAALSEDGKRAIDSMLQGRDQLSLEIVGVADTVRRDAYNRHLAERRAQAVSTYLATVTASRKAGSVKWSTSSRIVRVTPEGTYPPGEPHRGRRVDLGVIGLEVKQ